MCYWADRCNTLSSANGASPVTPSTGRRRTARSERTGPLSAWFGMSPPLWHLPETAHDPLAGDQPHHLSMVPREPSLIEFVASKEIDFAESLEYMRRR